MKEEVEQEQEQIERENKKNAEDEELDMKEFVKDMKDMRQRMNYATYQVQEQDKKLIGVNDKLDDYNKEVNKGDKYMDIINKSPFTYLAEKITGWFSFKKKEQLNKKNREIIEKARNKQIGNNNNNTDLILENDNNNDWTIINQEQNNDNKKKKIDDDDILDEALEEVKGMRKEVKQFNNAVIDSIDVVDVTNKNMDISLTNVNKVNQKMKKHK